MASSSCSEDGFQIIACILGVERNELQLGSIGGRLVRLYEPGQGIQVDQHEKDLLCACETVLKNARIESLLFTCHSLMESFGEILFSNAISFSSFAMLKSTLQDMEKLLKIIQGRICRESPDECHRLPSVSFEIMKRLPRTYSHEGISPLSLLRVKFVLLRVLLYDNASYQDVVTGNTLLHSLASCVWETGHMGGLEDIARAYVRHGCSLDAVNTVGQTAIDLLENSPHVCNVDLFQTLLSPPTTVLRLDEAAARVVVRDKINYQTLPQTLRDVVTVMEGGVSESDMVLLETSYEDDSVRQ